jgi:hypothetical protein
MLDTSSGNFLYGIGGDGAISVFAQQDADHYADLGRIGNVKQTHYGLFASELQHLFVAVPKQGSAPAAIQVFKGRP